MKDGLAGSLPRSLQFLGRTQLLVLALALVALAVPAWSFAQAPTFNAFIATPKGGESWFHPVNAAVGDFNGDGKLDALVSDAGPNLRLMLGNGNGTFNVQNVYTTPQSGPVPIKAADLNGDGRLDAVFSSPQGDLAPAVLLNTGNDVNGVPQFTLTTYTPVYSGLRSVTVGDLNGDSRPDFIVGNAYGSLYVYLNNGDGTFTAGQTTNLMPNVGGSTGSGVIADLNGDGKADYLVTSNQASATDIFFGNGDGTLQAPAVYPSNGLFPAVADLNEDGKPDFATVDFGNGNLMVYLNNGDGTFSGPTLISTGLTNPASLAIVDINGDGNLDAVISDFGSGSGVNGVAVFLGNGAGAFGSANLYTVNPRPLDVSVGDFNGDGKSDIATVGNTDNTYGVLLNTTVFAAPPTVFASGTATVTTWDPIFPSVAFQNWPAQCSAAPSVGPNANWVNPHAAFAFPLGSHPWEGIVPFNFAANWINAWDSLASLGPSGQSWTKYSTQVTGEGDFVVQFLADNCSWIYLDDQLIGVQDDNWPTNGTGRYPLTLTGTGPHTLSFIIWDGGGAAGGKFRLETRQSFIDGGGDVGGLTPSKVESTTTVSFGVGPFVYTGQAFEATASVSPSGVATITYSGDCTNAGSSCTATATYAGDANYDGSSATASITILKAPSVTTVSFGAGPFVYSGAAFTATASTSPVGTPTIVYTGDCTNAGSSCTATATYAGDANHAGSSAVATAEITKAPTTTTVSFGTGPFVYSGAAFTATASTSPVGTPTIVYTGDCTNAGSSCTATATYAGDANHTGSSATASITILKAPSVTTVSFGAGPFPYKGTAYTATASVSPGGVAAITYTGDCINGGTSCTATAIYTGDANHLGSSATATITITYTVCAAYDDDDDDDHGRDQLRGHESGSTVPVKVRVCDAQGRSIGSRSLQVKAIGLSPTGALNDSGKSNPGNLFRFDDHTYKFNLSTKGLAAGSYTLDYMIGADPTVYRYAFTIRPEKPKKDDRKGDKKDKDGKKS